MKRPHFRAQALVIVAVSLASVTGCQLLGTPRAPQPYANIPQANYPAGYGQNIPSEVQVGRPASNAGARAVQYVGSLANGFLRSAVGGAGFTAGRDIWRQIVD